MFIKINMRWKVKPFFSSASGIVSPAYPIKSRPASVTFFSNRIGSLSFRPIVPIFGVNVHNNIAQKDEQVEFLFLLLILMDLLLQKNRKNWECSEVLDIFSKSFYVWKMAPVGLIFRPQIGQYIGFRLFSWNFSAIFTWNLIYKLIGATFVGM